jgi:hypothetical protein
MYKSKPRKGKGHLSSVINHGSRYIDYRMAIGGGIVMGGIVFAVNYYGTHQLSGAITASLKQGIYTFLFGGIIMKSCERLAISIRKRTIAILAAILIPSAVAIGLTFGLHNLKGTPRPVASTIPTALLVIPSTAAWAIRKRKQHNTIPLNRF